MTARLLLLPGIGADRRMFDAQQSCAADVQVIEWIAPMGHQELLSDYAKRLAATIDTSRPFVVSGASLGGMVALEPARHIRPEAVILIASCRSPSSLPRYYRQLSAFAQLLPPPAFTGAFARSRLVTSRFGLRTPEERQLFADMLRMTPPSFVQWACRAIFEWAGAAELGVRIHHIHGANDRIIPLRYVRPDVVVPHAGHLLNITHAESVNAFIEGALSTSVT